MVDKKKDLKNTFFDFVRKQEVLSKDQELQLAIQTKSKNEKRAMEARDILILHNLKLVFYIAKKSYPFIKSADLLDVVQVGILGLIKGIKCYNPSRGRLTTYTSHWIKQTIQRQYFQKESTVRMPAYRHEKYSKYIKKLGALEEKLNRKLSYSEIFGPNSLLAKSLRKKTSEVKSILGPNIKVDSLNDNQYHNSEITLLNLLADAQSQKKWDTLIKKDLLETLLQILPKKEREIIDLRFFKRKSLEEIGKLQGRTRERIRQKVLIALTKMRTYAKILKKTE